MKHLANLEPIGFFPYLSNNSTFIMLKRLVLIALCYFNFSLILSTHAQISGCTDPQSNNYNPAATINDGSCNYNATSLTLTTKTSLSAPLLNETSGLAFVNGKLWTFNDSGNANDIYRVDTASSLVYQTVDISNATNVDWEDMTTSNDYLFIGDFGNNNGDRQNLRIYRIDKSALTSTATSVTASIINFSFSDQTSFQSLPTNHNFDCEAMIFLNDSIHLFSKNWVDFQTKHYVIPNTPGTHVAQYRETYNTGFLVTSASVQGFGVISLVGYLKTGTKPISMVMIYDYKNNLLFNGNKRKFDLSTQLTYGQVEGVEFFNSSYAFVTNELFTSGTTTVTAKLRTFNIAAFLPAAFMQPKPTANFTANNVSVCGNALVTFTNQSINSPTSYQWIFPGGTPATSTVQNPQIQYTTDGTYSVTLIASNGAGSDTLVKTNYSTVNPLPASSITAGGPTTFCPGGSVTLNANIGAGLTYQWNNNGASIPGATSSSYVANATGSYTCSVTNSCGSVGSNALVVTVSSTLTAPAAPSGATIVCKSTSNNLFTVAAVNGASSYTWSTPAGATISSGQGTNSISISFSSTAVSGNICVYASNSCGNSSTTCKAITVTSSVPAIPASITGNIIQCPGSTGVAFSCPAVTNASSYNWTVPSTATIASGQGTNSITVNFLSTFTSGSIKVAAVNCKGSSSFRSLSLYGKPSTPGTISGQLVGVCAGTNNVVYSIAPVNNATGYNWTAPANATIVNGQGTTTVSVNFSALFTSGSLKVSASNVCGSSSLRSAIIRSVPVTPGTISGTTSVCANQSGVAYSIAAVSGATGYSWVVPAGATVATGQNTTSITVNYGASGGTVKVRASNACGNSSYKNLTVSVTCREAYTQHESFFDVHISPNPSSSQFTLRFEPGFDSQVVFLLRDLAGREIVKYDNLSTGSDFEFGSDLATGVYLVEISNGEERKIIRLIKQE